MKKFDIEQIIDHLKEIKKISDIQNYTVSTGKNQHLMKITPLLENELDRLSRDKVTVNCPAIIIIKADKANEKTNNKSLTDFINEKLQELVMNDYKIIDYGIEYANNEILAYIKYTS